MSTDRKYETYYVEENVFVKSKPQKSRSREGIKVNFCKGSLCLAPQACVILSSIFYSSKS